MRPRAIGCQRRIAVSEGHGSIPSTSRHRWHMRNTTTPDGHRHQEIWLAEAFRLAQPKRVHHQTDVLMLGCLPCGSPVAPQRNDEPRSRVRKPSNHSLTRGQDHCPASWIGSSPRSESIGDASMFTKRVRVSGTQVGAVDCRHVGRPRVATRPAANRRPLEPTDWRYRPIAATSRSDSASSQTDSGG